jgi:peroxiredoxin
VRRRFADRFLALARDSAADPAARDAVVDALTWVIIQCPGDPRGKEAVDRFVHGPISSEQAAGACERLAAKQSTIAEPIFRAVIQSSPHRAARARATLALARALRRRSEETIGRGPAELARAEEWMGEADSLYQDAIQHYSQLRIGRETLAEIAERELFELRNLAVGRAAPDIEGPDLEGRPMALKDFRGKVVVLEFWGHWCSVCRESFPQDQRLVERMRGKPFILLGVNSDRPEIGAAVARQDPIAQRSWRDGGEVLGGDIARRWNVTALPTTYIIDHRGIIRCKLGPRPDGHDPVREVLDPAGGVHDKWQSRAERIEAVVAELLAEMESAPDSVARPSSVSRTPADASRLSR